MSSWNDAPHGPRSRFPKYLVPETRKPRRARRTPFPREPPPVSLARETAGSSGVQTSAKRQAGRNVHALRLFFSPPPFFFHTLPLSFYLLCVVVQTPTPLFCQINISQNKSQDNFKLAREERRRREREGERGRKGGWFSLQDFL